MNCLGPESQAATKESSQAETLPSLNFLFESLANALAKKLTCLSELSLGFCEVKGA